MQIRLTVRVEEEQAQAGELEETATTQGETLKLCLHSSSLASKGH